MTQYAWIVAVMLILPVYAYLRKKPVLTPIREGCQESISVAWTILPYICAMMVVVAMLRASGCFELLSGALGPIFSRLGVPVDLMPLMLVRPFSGSSSNAIFADIVHTYGGNAMVSQMAATMMGSTETTLYVLAVYFGAVQIKKMRYALYSGLLADVAGMLTAIFIAQLWH